MKQVNKIIILTCLLFSSTIAQGQSYFQPKYSFVALGGISDISSSLLRTTNYNPSVYLGDTMLAVVADSLRSDGTATIVTVYETDADSTVGLWQIGSGRNRSLWLNSHRVSYDDIAITYHTSNEHGVVIHAMNYKYPAPDSTYDGHDTIFLGREGDLLGDKNLCTFLYFPGKISRRFQRQMESTLAIRYGALLHGPYINRVSDTLWNPLGYDSLYSFGVCGIGRDDSLSLLQSRSVIRGDILTIEAPDPLSDLDCVMLGCDSNAVNLDDENFVHGTESYVYVARHWKLRAHTLQDSITIHLSANLPVPKEALRIMLTSENGTVFVAPSTTDLSFTVALADSQDYHVALLVNTAALTKRIESCCLENTESETNQFSVTPNPTSGRYTVNIDQPDDDIVSIRIVDALGRTIDCHTTSKPFSKYTYNGVLTADGIYYIIVSSNGRQKTIKLVVVK